MPSMKDRVKHFQMIMLKNSCLISKQILGLLITVGLTVGAVFGFGSAALAQPLRAISTIDLGLISQHDSNQALHSDQSTDRLQLALLLGIVRAERDNTTLNQPENLIDRSKQQLKDRVGDIRENVRDITQTDQAQDSNASLEDIQDRASNRIERAKETFKDATERVVRDEPYQIVE